MAPPLRQIRAAYDDATVVVYQAYSPVIAVATVERGAFPTWYERDRMTWIKPSFLWMMYRSGWAGKPGQEHVLAIRLHRAGFEWALRHSALSHYDRHVHADRADWQRSLAAPVRIQWDPERDLHLDPLPHRAIQIGLSGEAVHRYVDEWIVDVADVTDLAKRVRATHREQHEDVARRLLPAEAPYPVDEEIAARIGLSAA